MGEKIKMLGVDAITDMYIKMDDMNHDMIARPVVEDDMVDRSVRNTKMAKSLEHITVTQAIMELQEHDAVTNGEMKKLKEIQDRGVAHMTLQEIQYIIGTYSRYFIHNTRRSM